MVKNSSKEKINAAALYASPNNLTTTVTMGPRDKND